MVNKRHKRDLETVIEADSVVTEDGAVSRVVVFDCGRKSAKCFTISCNLPRLKRRDFAVIKLRSRVWNSTFFPNTFRTIECLKFRGDFKFLSLHPPFSSSAGNLRGFLRGK